MADAKGGASGGPSGEEQVDDEWSGSKYGRSIPGLHVMTGMIER